MVIYCVSGDDTAVLSAADWALFSSVPGATSKGEAIAAWNEIYDQEPYYETCSLPQSIALQNGPTVLPLADVPHNPGEATPEGAEPPENDERGESMQAQLVATEQPKDLYAPKRHSCRWKGDCARFPKPILDMGKYIGSAISGSLRQTK